MDAVKFIKEWNRMLETEGRAPDIEYYPVKTSEQVVFMVEDWAKNHPVKTRQSEFLKQWPNVKIDNQGILLIDPCDLDNTMRRKDKDCYKGCHECRCEFWMQEVE